MQTLSKSALTITLLLLAVHFCYAQESIKAYVDFQSYKNDKAITLNGIDIELRTNGDIIMNGGNDYKITSEERSVTKEIKKEYWAIEASDTLYVNGWVLMRNKWYAKVLYRSANYLFFVAGGGVIQGGHQAKAVAAGMMFGAVGGAAYSATAAMKRYNYLMDLKTGEVFGVTRKLMLDFLVNNPDLQKRYSSEKDSENKNTIIKYLAEIDK